jgi:hypothetical protein
MEKEPPASGLGRQADSESSPPRVLDLGRIVGTPGALQAPNEAGRSPEELILRHVTGDWGDLPEEDIEENKLSVEKGFCVFSSYRLPTGTKVRVITEWDRSVTMFLLPSEY